MIIAAVLAVVILLIVGYSHRTLKAADSATEEAWFVVQNIHQTRTSLLPRMKGLVEEGGEKVHSHLKSLESALSEMEEEILSQSAPEEDAFIQKYERAETDIRIVMNQLWTAARDDSLLGAGTASQLSAFIQSSELRVDYAHWGYNQALGEYHLAITTLPMAFFSRLYGYSIRTSLQE